MVSASCDTEDADWNTATGSKPTAHSAHLDRGARRIASQTITNYAPSTANRSTMSMPSTLMPSCRVTNAAAACGEYGTGEPKVEKVTKPCERSPDS